MTRRDDFKFKNSSNHDTADSKKFKNMKALTSGINGQVTAPLHGIFKSCEANETA